MASMKSDEALDFVQMKDGTSYMGEVTNPSFEFVIGGGSRLTLARDHVISIEMRNRIGLTKDRVHTKDGSQILGDLVTPTLSFTSDETGPLNLPFADVLVVQLTF
ncbi:MAG: hypothetical protein ACHREM_09555 [Polyangiales bacterium]